MTILFRAGIVAALIIGPACQGEGSGSGGNGGADGVVIGNQELDRSHMSYVANLLAREAAGEWTLYHSTASNSIVGYIRCSLLRRI
jgi:hypothetical protein